MTLVPVVLLVLAVLAWSGGPPGVREAAGDIGVCRRAARRGEGRERRPPSRSEVAEVARLLAASLRGGIGVVEALEVVAELGPPHARPDLRVVVAAARWGRSPERCWSEVGQAWGPVATALVTADDAGLSPVRALEAAATQLDRERRSQVEAAVRKVEVLVVLPLGLAFLPGFVLAAVVPLVIGLAGGLAGP